MVHQCVAARVVLSVLSVLCGCVPKLAWEKPRRTLRPRRIVDKIAQEHAVKQSEIREVFDNRPLLRFVEKGHRLGENVYSALGRTEAGRYLVVFFIHKKKGQALILSARDMTASERRLYGKK